MQWIIFSQILLYQRQNTFIFPVLSLSISFPHCYYVFCCPGDPGAELFFWQVSDEQVRILSVHTSMAQIKSPSFLHPGSSCLEKKHTCQKNASLVRADRKSRYTHKPVGLKLSRKCRRGWHFQKNSKNARIRENAMDFPLLFKHYSGSHNKWCQLFSDVIAK